MYKVPIFCVSCVCIYLLSYVIEMLKWYATCQLVRLAPYIW